MFSSEAPSKLQRLGKVRGGAIFAGEHSWRIEPGAEGGARFTQHERFSGFLVLFMGKMLNQTEAGFEQMNAALKARVEGGGPG